MIQKKKSEEVFRVVGVIHADKTIEQIAVDIDVLASDLKGDASNGRSCVSNAEAIMHMCADILAMSKSR